jgi:hypothetical protein
MFLCQLVYAQNSCYQKYKDQGDALKRKGDLSTAKKEYQNASNCRYLTNAQRIEIDSLIKDIDKRLPATPRRRN